MCRTANLPPPHRQGSTTSFNPHLYNKHTHTHTGPLAPDEFPWRRDTLIGRKFEKFVAVRFCQNTSCLTLSWPGGFLILQLSINSHIPAAEARRLAKCNNITHVLMWGRVSTWAREAVWCKKHFLLGFLWLQEQQIFVREETMLTCHLSDPLHPVFIHCVSKHTHTHTYVWGAVRWSCWVCVSSISAFPDRARALLSVVTH